MSEAQLLSYEEVPYEAKPLYPTHPDCTSTLAALLGMTPAPLDNCRVLELGCATGGNLLPMAQAFPNSEFVGIDLAPRQIAMGQEIVDVLGLKNISLRALSILDVDESLGTFDYIICHGVYSWVPPQVQDKILSVSKKLLARHGIAYVSYNTFPGWHQRRMIREMLHFHVKQFDDPATKVQQSRAFLDFMVRSIPKRHDEYRQIIETEASLLKSTADFYLFHEHLEDINVPMYFTDFMKHAQQHGLQYLGESYFPNRIDDLPEETKATLQGLSENILELEQYLDFIRNRKFRRTLLVHDDIALNRTPTLSVLKNMHLSSLVRPESATPDLVGEGQEHFTGEDGAGITTNHPVFKIALASLYEAWPKTVPYAELIATTVQKLQGSRYPATSLEVEAMFAERLIRCYMSNLIAIHTWAPPMALAVSERPLASPLARYQAEKGFPLLTNLRHRMVKIQTMDRFVLPKLDGQHDRSALMAHLHDLVDRDILEIRKDDVPLKGSAQLDEILRESLEDSLHRIAAMVLLLA